MGRVLRGSCFPVLAACLLLAGCESSPSSSHRLPAYETPLARTNFQTVRTTAYTDTEADHLAYTNHNALGGILHAAGTPLSPGVMVAAAGPIRQDADDEAEEIAGIRPVANESPAVRPASAVRPVSMVRPASAVGPPAAARPAGAVRPVTMVRPAGAVGPPTAARPAAVRPTSEGTEGNPAWMAVYLKRKQQQQQPQPQPSQEGFHPTFYITPATATGYAAPVVYGSAAADWSRWPVGTVFRIQSTGQVYQVDDYGWALAGRNTIDLYHATKADMNAWGVRHEPIQILHWGSREESLRLLRNHQGYKHIRRMVLELEGHDHAAAELE